MTVRIHDAYFNRKRPFAQRLELQSEPRQVHAERALGRGRGAGLDVCFSERGGLDVDHGLGEGSDRGRAFRDEVDGAAGGRFARRGGRVEAGAVIVGGALMRGIVTHETDRRVFWKGGVRRRGP